MNDNENNPAPQTGEVASVFRSINLMSVGVAALLSTGMIVDRHSVTVSVLSGVGFYGAIAGLLILWQPGALPAVLINHQREITVRRRDELPYRAQSAPAVLTVVEPLQLAHTPSAPAMLPYASTFVAPHDDSAEREAVAWMLQLYGADGTPDAKKVLLASDKEKPGRIRIAAPSRPAKEWLLARHLIHDLGNGFRLNLGRCPTIADARIHLSPGYGGGMSPTYPPPQQGGHA
jgi:hypothetical protein